MDPTSWASLIKDGGLFAVAVVALVFSWLERQRANGVQDARNEDHKENIAALVKATIAMEASSKSNENVVNLVGQISNTQREILIAIARRGAK